MKLCKTIKSSKIQINKKKNLAQSILKKKLENMSIQLILRIITKFHNIFNKI